jgi:hypothetical protein
MCGLNPSASSRVKPVMSSNPELTYSIAPDGSVMMMLSPVCSTADDKRWTSSWLRLLEVMSRITNTPPRATPAASPIDRLFIPIHWPSGTLVFLT